MNNAGKALAQQFANAGRDCAVILAMGQAATTGTSPNYTQGVNFIAGGFGSTNEVLALTEQFVLGYMTVASSTTSHVTIILSVNLDCPNMVNCACANVVLCIVNDYGVHATAWAGTVQQANSYVQSNYDSIAHISVHSGADLEANFNSAGNSRAWIESYQNAGTGTWIYDYGDAGGCPPSDPTATDPSIDYPCNNGWKQSDVWWVAWGYTFSQAFPEIYFPINAQQWARISQYGQVQQGGRTVNFSGVLTQYAKCVAHPATAGCGIDSSGHTTTLTPYDGLTQLNTAVNQSIPWSSDINDAP